MHTTEQIPIDKAKLLKKDLLRGYKEVSKPEVISLYRAQKYSASE
jgi:hypothetical protein